MTKSVSSQNYSVLLKLLSNARKQSGLTQKAVADKLHQSQSYVSKYENGDRRLDVVEFIEVANALKIAPVGIVKDLIHDWK